MGSSVKKIWEWCRHYISVTFIIVVVFVVIVLFFNENSILKSMEYNRQITDLKEEIQSNRDTLEYYNKLNHSLDTDPETMERIVRERYRISTPIAINISPAEVTHGHSRLEFLDVIPDFCIVSKL